MTIPKWLILMYLLYWLNKSNPVTGTVRSWRHINFTVSKAPEIQQRKTLFWCYQEINRFFVGDQTNSGLNWSLRGTGRWNTASLHLNLAFLGLFPLRPLQLDGRKGASKLYKHAKILFQWSRPRLDSRTNC